MTKGGDIIITECGCQLTQVDISLLDPEVRDMLLDEGWFWCDEHGYQRAMVG